MSVYAKVYTAYTVESINAVPGLYGQSAVHLAPDLPTIPRVVLYVFDPENYRLGSRVAIGRECSSNEGRDDAAPDA